MLYYSGLSRTLRQLRWVLYPRRCPFCDRVLGNQPACPDCADGLAELRRAPSMRLRGSEHYLGRLDGAAAPYRYTGLVRRAVLRAKYQGAPGQLWSWAWRWPACFWQRDQNVRL